ncbi:polysaccharide biosynthesis protein [Chromobacterium fluminis]|uniref:polysaccharide biosynthesis protein n=1 Tax=Chromobacterium fluminis TaxID=3044269 RepID=UPI00197D0925|nr:polysaccharide biosynthesis protein [Chromobacterium haemolyticum]
MKCNSSFFDLCIRFFLEGIRNKDHLRLEMSSIDLVVHAAELKQVPVAGYNPTECIRTNVNDAENEIGAVLACRVEKVIELSVDKKASLINLYGAIKLLSDKVFMAANNIIGSHKRQFAVTLWQRGGSTVRVFS